MLKMAGIIFIIIGTVGYGKYLCSYLKIHLEQLVECREIFAQLETEREYLRLPYGQLLRRSAKGKPIYFQKILQEVADEMEKNKEADAELLWKDAYENQKKYLLLKEEEKELLLGLFKSLLLEGDHSQVSKMYFLQLEDKITQAMEEKKEKQKLYGTVSVLSGIFLIILLI